LEVRFTAPRKHKGNAIMETTQINSAPAEQTEATEVSWLRKHRTAVIASCATLVVIAVAGIAAISTGVLVPVKPATSHASAVSPTASSTPAAASSKKFDPATVKIGDTVQWADKLPAGFFAYQMPDQSYVAVNQDQPLPPAVEAALHRQAQSSIKPALTATNASVTAGEAATFINDTFGSTGKLAVVIVHTTGGIGNAPMTYQWIGMSSDWNPALAAPTEAQVEAAAQARIAASAHPARYEIIVVQ
jgi:hypothetical protein